MTPPLRLGVASYSYWHFTPEKVPLEYVIDQAHALGLRGVEVVQKQLESEEPSYLNHLRRYAFRKGVTLYNLGTAQDFVTDDPAERRAEVESTKRAIDVADRLGAASIRINAGRWRRGDTFGGLLETRGWSEPWAGATQEEGFAWAVEGLSACAEYAEQRGVMLLLENHWGLTTTASGMVRLLKTVDSPWLRAILDTGNFYFEEDMYLAMETLAPWVDLMHAKSYPGGGLVLTLEIDHERVFRILNEAGFTGYVSVEMEGKEAAETAVPRSIAALNEAWERAQE